MLQVGKGKIVRVEGIQNQGRTATALLRASNKLVLEEAERSLHDALCVVRCLVRKQFLIPGGAAPEVELNLQLSRWAKTLVVSLYRFSPIIFFQPLSYNPLPPTTQSCQQHAFLLKVDQVYLVAIIQSQDSITILRACPSWSILRLLVRPDQLQIELEFLNAIVDILAAFNVCVQSSLV